MATDRIAIPLLDTLPEVESIWRELAPALEDVIKDGQFIMGPNVRAFEKAAAEYLSVKHALGCNSGTDALSMGLRGLGIGPGDEVITTAFTFFATAEAVSHVGASPVFVDIDEKTFNIDVRRIEEKITPRTKAIIPVHLFGHACDMDPLMEIARRHNLKVLEDVAQAFGGDYKGEKLAGIGDGGSLSFFPSKNLGAFGDGGMFVTNDDDVAETVKMLRVHGSKKKYFNEVIGYNSRLDEIQATVLSIKLPHLDEWNEGRRRAADRYAELLGEIPGVTPPAEEEYARHVYHQYTVRVEGMNRDELQNRLKDEGISSMVYYPTPLHWLPIYSHMDVRLPVTEKAASEVISLPIWPKITPDVQERVADALHRILTTRIRADFSSPVNLSAA
jgi:dTDP-4-amino-4,6-dideoxygalactose transaminase